MIKAILYDKDGTLIDLAGSWLDDISLMIRGYCRGNDQEHQRVAEAIGIDVSNNTVTPFSIIAQCTLRDTAAALHGHLLPLSSPAPSVETLLQQLIEINNATHRPRPLPGVIETITQLHQQGLIQGIISNDREQGIARAIDALGIGAAIGYVRGSDSGCGHKPAPEMVWQCCDQFGLAPEQVMVVGDSPADMETAQAAGCQRIVGIHPDPHDRVLGHYSAHILPDLRLLPTLL